MPDNQAHYRTPRSGGQGNRQARPPADSPSSPSQRALSESMQLVVVLAILGGAIGLVYGPAVDAPFIFDDVDSVETNSSIERLWPLVGSGEQPGPLNPKRSTPTAGRPVVNFSFAVDYYFHGLDPAGFRLQNIVLHLMSAMLLWALVRRTLRLDCFAGRFDAAAGPLALATALLWALHPLHTETLEYVTQRTELMVSLWYLATLYCSLRYWTASSAGGRSVWACLAVAACWLGMGSKEVMVSAPLVVLLYERTFLRGSFRAALQQSWRLYVGLLSGWLPLLLLNDTGPRADSAGFHLGIPILDWWFNQATVFWMYVKLTLWPSPLLIHYEFVTLEPLSQTWMYVLATVLVVVGVGMLVWRNHPAGFPLATALIVLAPTHLVPIVTEAAAERRMYLPLAPLIALVVAGSFALFRRTVVPAAAQNRAPDAGRFLALGIAAIAFMLAMVYGVVDSRRLKLYHSSTTLWQDVVNRQPHSRLGNYNLAVELAAEGRLEEAIAHCREAVRLNPDHVEPLYYLGRLLDHVGQTDEAAQCFQKVLEMQPDAFKTRNNLGVLLLDQGQVEEAITQFRKAIELQPDLWEAYDNLGRALIRSGKFVEAIETYQLALLLKPEDVAIHAYLAEAFSKAGRAADAIAAAEKALKLAQSAGETAAAKQIATSLARYRAAAAKPLAPQRPGEPNPKIE